MSTFIGQDKPSLDEALLEHHGVKGMRWGVRRATKSVGGQIERHYQQKDAHDKSILEARSNTGNLRTQHIEARKNYRAIKKQTNRQDEGRKAAKAILREVGDRRLSNLDLALEETSKERMSREIDATIRRLAK